MSVCLCVCVCVCVCVKKNLSNRRTDASTLQSILPIQGRILKKVTKALPREITPL